MSGAAPPKVAAAGSLKAPFRALAEAFRAASGVEISCTFGPSGLLRERIEAGEAFDVFASADRGHPERLAAPRGLAVATFARNALCALVRPGCPATSDTLLDLLLDPATRVATSTPVADPSGDYAWQLFDGAGALRPGAADRLKEKALQLAGKPDSAKPEGERSVYGWIMETGQADIFLTYRTNALAARAEVPELRIVELPATLAVSAEYGLVVLGGGAASRAFAAFVLSGEGQAILAARGFGPGGAAPR